MDLRPVAHIIGQLLLILAAVMLVMAAVSYGLGEPAAGMWTFVNSAACAGSIGLASTVLTRRPNYEISSRQIYLLTVSAWVVLSSFSALPFMFSPLHLGLTDSVFEAVSGITTTGSTILSGLDDTLASILLWRAVLQWVGGVGIIVMVISVLPHLRVGGMRLFRAEASDKSDKFTARAVNVARSIGLVYLTLSIACASAYWLAGMDAFNAIYHAMTTVSTGGFSTSDLSLRQFADTDVIWTSSVFMVLSAVPLVHYVHMARGDRRAFVDDEQVRGFLALLLISSLLLTIWLVYTFQLGIVQALRTSVFHVVSVVTTTGYASADYGLWGGFAVTMIYFLTFVGGCAGSTAGGIKIFRFQVAAMILRNHTLSMTHPSLVSTDRYNGRLLPPDVLMSVAAFSLVFAATVALLAVALGMLGLDLVTSLTGAATAVANVGPGLGDVIGPSGNFSTLPASAKWLLAIGMIMGRLELMTAYVLLTPSFWRG